jgi:hypothetical protein
VTRADQVTDGHRLVIRMRGGRLAVTCPCLLTRVRSQVWQPYERNGLLTQRRQSNWERRVIESRPAFPLAEALAAWRDYHEREGIPV